MLLRLVEITDAPVREALVGGGAGAAEERAELAGAVLGDVAGRDLLEQALYLDTRMFLPDGILICNDKMSMAASLELRVPFLDVDLMRFVERIPAHERIRPAAGQAPAPPGDGAAAAKRGRQPAQARLRHPLRRLAARVARRGGRAPLRARRAPRRRRPAGGRGSLVGEHRRGRADHKRILYCLLELSEWHRAFVEAREPRGRVNRLLYVHSRKASFVAIDREILAERYVIEDLYQPGRLPNPVKVIRGVLRADVVFGWFASWHTFFPITLAWVLRKPSVLIIGGFDTADMPDIGYGYQQGGLRRWASRWIMRRAGRLITNSSYSLTEIERNTPIPPDRVTVIHHGVPDPFGDLPESQGPPGADGRGHRSRHVDPEGPAPLRPGRARAA